MDKFSPDRPVWPFLKRFAELWNSSESVAEVRSKLAGRPHLVSELAYKCRRMGVHLKTFETAGVKEVAPDIVDLVNLTSEVVGKKFSSTRSTGLKSLDVETFEVTSDRRRKIRYRTRNFKELSKFLSRYFRCNREGMKRRR